MLGFNVESSFVVIGKGYDGWRVCFVLVIRRFRFECIILFIVCGNLMGKRERFVFRFLFLKFSLV